MHGTPKVQEARALKGPKGPLSHALLCQVGVAALELLAASKYCFVPRFREQY